MNKETIAIDKVVSNYTAVPGEEDRVYLEWFEVNKRRLTRDTTSGKSILIQLDEGKKWRNGDALFAGDELQAILTIKPSLVIRFDPEDLAQMADFCYYIGNRHLPIFKVNETDSVRVSYDGPIYEQVLVKFGQAIQLEEAQLLFDDVLKPKRNN